VCGEIGVTCSTNQKSRISANMLSFGKLTYLGNDVSGKSEDVMILIHVAARGHVHCLVNAAMRLGFL
jgi:hypothetical protein